MKVYKYHVATRDNEPCTLDRRLNPLGFLRPCEVGEKPYNFGDYYAEGRAAAASAIARTVKFSAELRSQGHMFGDWDGLTKFEKEREFVIYHTPSERKQRRAIKLAFA